MKRQDNNKIKVVFRKYKDTGDIVALFPTVPEDLYGYKCSGYAHIGQHFSADPLDMIQITYRCKTRAEYAELLRELISIGYDNLLVSERISRHDFAKRREAARVWRETRQEQVKA